jgi:transcriptional regulator GlxA family with amidase domain
MDGFHFRAIKIPIGGNEWLAMGTRGLLAEPLAQDNWMTRLIGATFNAIVAQRFEAPAETAIRHLAQLALLARGRVAPGSRESRSALRHGYLHEALRLMEQWLPRPELSPELIAGALNISVRQLHLLFEPTGQSFSRTLLAMRLAEARQQLEAMPPQPVGEIANACGFDSIATFYRTFGRAYGMAPGDLRKSLLRH